MPRHTDALRDQAARHASPHCSSMPQVDRVLLQRDEDPWPECRLGCSGPDLEMALVTILLQLADAAVASGDLQTMARLRGAAELLRDQSTTSISGEQPVANRVAVLLPVGPSTQNYSRQATSRRARRRCPLTPREHEVAELLVLGWTNRRIAEHLVVSVRTVSTHVAQILSKLGLSSRAQVPAWLLAHEDGVNDRPAIGPSGRQMDRHRAG